MDFMLLSDILRVRSSFKYLNSSMPLSPEILFELKFNIETCSRDINPFNLDMLFLLRSRRRRLFSHPLRFSNVFTPLSFKEMAVQVANSFVINVCSFGPETLVIWELGDIQEGTTSFPSLLLLVDITGCKKRLKTLSLFLLFSKNYVKNYFWACVCTVQVQSMFKLLFSIFCLACPIHSYVKVLNLRHFKTNLFGKNEFSLKVAGDDVKQRLDVFLASQISEHSRSFLGNLCDQSAVNVNNTPQTKNYKVKKGDVVTLTIEDIAPSSVEPEDIPLDILYEDDDIIAVNKPPGMVVHPAPGSPNNTFVNALLYHIGKSAADLLNANSSETRTLSTTTTTMTTTSDLLIDEEGWETIDLPETPEAAVSSSSFLRPGIVHRLDKGTSGVLIAGKHPEAVSKLSRLFFLREIRKIYLAICVGHPGEATMVDPIGRCSKNRQLMTVYDGPPGKPATSHFRTLAFDGKLSAALVRIETGRSVTP